MSRASLPRVELMSVTFFLCEAEAPFAAVLLRRIASISLRRLAASSRFSSVSLRNRSCGTQSSHLRVWR